MVDAKSVRLADPSKTFLSASDPVRMPWTTALATYTTDLRAQRRSPGTARLHRHYVRNLARVVRCGPWEVEPDQLRAFVASYTTRSAETQKSARASVAAFYRWAFQTGRIDRDLAATLPGVAVPPGKPRPAPEAVLKRALDLANDRLRLMLLLAAYSGLRCAEVARVHTCDLVDGVLYVTGKGGKVRRVPIAREDVVAAIVKADGYLFPGRVEGHLSAARVSELMAEALPDGWTGHTLRHRFATRAYAGTRDLLAVGELLGHSRPETTKRYVLTPDDALRAAVAAAA